MGYGIHIADTLKLGAVNRTLCMRFDVSVLRTAGVFLNLHNNTTLLKLCSVYSQRLTVHKCKDHSDLVLSACREVKA